MPAPKIGFIYLGGAHQVVHTAAVAGELAMSGAADVHAFFGSDCELRTFAALLAPDAFVRVHVHRLPVSRTVRAVGFLHRKLRALKIPRLFASNAALVRMDALVTAERTSTALKSLPGRKPMLIHIPHGAGDRAKGFEARLSRFDYVIVAGPKDRQRMVDSRLVPADRCAVAGYVKLATLNQVRPTPLSDIFGNDRPVVLYAPHFDPTLSSWATSADRLIETFANQGHYNLVVAPHVRMFEGVAQRGRAMWESRSVPGRVHVDLGSDRSFDMTYTRGAAIYVGDVSSQVYEFVCNPRPCLFLNPGKRRWQGDPNFKFWEFGPVLEDVGDMLPALGRAIDQFADRRMNQIEACREAFGADWTNAPRNAANLILDVLSMPRIQQRDVLLDAA